MNLLVLLLLVLSEYRLATNPSRHWMVQAKLWLSVSSHSTRPCSGLGTVLAQLSWHGSRARDHRASHPDLSVRQTAMSPGDTIPGPQETEQLARPPEVTRHLTSLFFMVGGTRQPVWCRWRQPDNILRCDNSLLLDRLGRISRHFRGSLHVPWWE